MACLIYRFIRAHFDDESLLPMRGLSHAHLFINNHFQVKKATEQHLIDGLVQRNIRYPSIRRCV